LSSDDDLLNDILDAAEEAVSYVEGMMFDEFRQDRKTQAAVMYRLGIIGEAARYVTAETQSKYSVDWTAMRGMRNRLVHGYGSVRPLIVWKTVTEDLPTLILELRK
jgi:uncharacterized protein with HEPN domain